MNMVWQPKALIPLALSLGAGIVLAMLWLTAQRHGTAPKPWAPEDRKAFETSIALPTLHGPILRLSAFQGYVVLLNFWATWCYPCRAEMPSMNALYQRYRDKGFTIIAIASDAPGRMAVAPYAEQQNLLFPVLLDPQNTVGTRLQVSGIPTSYLLDHQGRVASIQVGARDWHAPRMRRLIDVLLAETGNGPGTPGPMQPAAPRGLPGQRE
jgi:thiol-disulfide isomerase/thioredoxin